MVYAVLILNETGKAITHTSIQDILESVGIIIDHSAIDTLLKSLEYINIEEILRKVCLVPDKSTNKDISQTMPPEIPVIEPESMQKETNIFENLFK